MLEFILNYINPQDLFLILIFLISFGLINFSLSKVFRSSPQLSPVLSLLLSIGVAYGIYYSGFDLENLIFSIGIDTEIILIGTLILILIGLIYLLKKIGFNKTLMIFGLCLIGLSFVSYERTIVLISGVVVFVLGLLFWMRSKKKQGIGNNQPNQQNNTNIPNPIDGIKRIEAEAKIYRQWADRQQSPKWNRNWAHFIDYLKSRGYGGNENEICMRLNIKSSDIQRAVKKYIL
jgi:hypothetical protein